MTYHEYETHTHTHTRVHTYIHSFCDTVSELCLASLYATLFNKIKKMNSTYDDVA